MSSDESELGSVGEEEIELDVPDLEAPDFDPYRFCNNILNFMTCRSFLAKEKNSTKGGGGV